MTLEADLEAVINSPGTKSAKARALYSLGCDRTDAVELIGMNYSQAHSVWKEFHGNGNERAAARSTRRGRSKQGEADDQLQSGKASGEGLYRLNLRPRQTRLITQDGHVVYRDLDGKNCTGCDNEITFSLRHLGFVHTRSKSEPTKLEDHYGG